MQLKRYAIWLKIPKSPVAYLWNDRPDHIPLGFDQNKCKIGVNKCVGSSL